MPNVTQFNVTNRTNGRLANQKILVYLTPVTTARHWTYAAWQVLAPGEGGMSPFQLVDRVSVRMHDEETDYVSNMIDVEAGSMVELVNPDGLFPVLRPLLDPGVGLPVVDGFQRGVRNNTNGPGHAPKAQWFVNGKMACQSLVPLWAGGTLSALDLELVLYFSVGLELDGACFSFSQISGLRRFAFTPNTRNVDVVLTFDEPSKTFQWSFATT